MIGLFVIVILLELITLADYVFSYLYIGPILLANLRLNRRIAICLTGLASTMIIVNLWIPSSRAIWQGNRRTTNRSSVDLVELIEQVTATLNDLALSYQVSLHKGADIEMLVLALRSVQRGASWWDSTATAEIYALAATKNATESTSPLTPREQEILQLITAGKTTQEIAEAFHITPGTVRVHIHAILQKLEVRDRTQAALLALRKGLVSHNTLNQ